MRIYFSFQSPTFVHDAYLHLERVEYTAETGKMLMDNPLSYGGSKSFYLPLFYYILALFSKFLPIEFVVKILPSLFASSIVFVIYYIVYQLTKNNVASLFSAFTSAFIPVFFVNTINTISPFSLALPLLFLCVAYFLDNKKYLNYYLITLLILTFTSSVVLILVFGLLIYLALLKSAGIKELKSSNEIIVFTTFISMWLNLILYQKLISNIGYSLIWANVPQTILFQYFSNFNILSGIFQIGLFPFLFGIFIMYWQIFKKETKEVYFIISLTLVVLLLLWLKLIELSLGLSLLGLCLTILFGVFVNGALYYFQKTKVSHLSKYFIFVLFCLIFVSSLLSSFVYALNIEYPSDKLLDDLHWIKENTPENSIILSNAENGFMINQVAERKNVFDLDFYYIKNPNQYFIEVNKIFVTPYMTDSIKLLEKYDVDYILLSGKNISSYDESCFEIQSPNILKVKCKIGGSK